MFRVDIPVCLAAPLVPADQLGRRDDLDVCSDLCTVTVTVHRSEQISKSILLAITITAVKAVTIVTAATAVAVTALTVAGWPMLLSESSPGQRGKRATRQLEGPGNLKVRVAA